MSKSLKLIFTAVLLFAGLGCARAQSMDCDVFVPICKYISKGDANALSVWFADSLEISVASENSNASRNQARQILKTFFDRYSPRSFKVDHTVGQGNMRYLLGELNAGGETFHVIIFVCCPEAGGGYLIQQLKIEKL
ncbi:MAG: DUF4783 domain-containing protein [Bacteroidales bacterium]|nr:DUF4783 domain-containing protein [Bacteroidales bacterium]